MFTKIPIITSTGTYSSEIKRLKLEIDTADAIVIGAGAGMSTAAGLTYSGRRFDENFSDFHQKYGITDMYSGGFYPYATLEEYWAWWSRQILLNRYDQPAGKPYLDLFKLVQTKTHFVITTNVDHQFQIAGFGKDHLFYTQGDYGLWQCSKPCHQMTYHNETDVRRMAAEQQNMRIPSALIPHCPACGAPMSMHLRCDNTFVQDGGWYTAQSRYEEFIHTYRQSHILFLELGVGANTPGIIKYPFWQLTRLHPQAVYACVNDGDACCPREIGSQSICLNHDIRKVLTDLLGK